MKTKILKRLCLYVGLASLLASPSLVAQTAVDLVRFQSSNVADSDLDYIDIDALIINTGSGVRIGIFNNTDPSDPSASATKPTVASIFFDASPLLSSTPTFNAAISSSGIDFQFGGAPPNLPGGNEIGFSADSKFTATPPPPKNGLNPGEFAYFDFAGSDYNSVVNGLYNDSVRIGAHVLQTGPDGENSVGLVTVIPEPSSALLGLCGLTALLLRRKR